MKNFKILFAAIAILTAACNKEESVLKAKTDEQKEIWVEDGTLYLKNQQVLDSLSISVGKMTNEERIAWEDSLGYTSYKTLYSFIFSEYEKMAENVEEIGSDEPYFEFRELYEDLAVFPDEDIDGDVNRTIEPKVTLYSCLTNEEGKLIVENKEIGKLKVSSLKSSQEYFVCDKSTSSRKMKVDVYMGPNIPTVVTVLSCKKKVLFGWWNYTSVFYVQTNTYPGTQAFSGDTGTQYYPNGWSTTLLTVWNDGIGYSRRCEFSYY